MYINHKFSYAINPCPGWTNYRVLLFRLKNLAFLRRCSLVVGLKRSEVLREPQVGHQGTSTVSFSVIYGRGCHRHPHGCRSTPLILEAADKISRFTSWPKVSIAKKPLWVIYLYYVFLSHCLDYTLCYIREIWREGQRTHPERSTGTLVFLTLSILCHLLSLWFLFFIMSE